MIRGTVSAIQTAGWQDLHGAGSVRSPVISMKGQVLTWSGSKRENESISARRGDALLKFVHPFSAPKLLNNLSRAIPGKRGQRREEHLFVSLIGADGMSRRGRRQGLRN